MKITKKKDEKKIKNNHNQNHKILSKKLLIKTVKMKFKMLKILSKKVIQIYTVICLAGKKTVNKAVGIRFMDRLFFIYFY